jgi:predicted permease
MWVGMPFLILSSTLGLDLKDATLLKGMGLSMAITLGYVAVWFFITALLTKKEGEIKKQGMVRFCMMFSNNGFLGLPLAAAVLGEGTEAYSYLVISNVLTNLLMYTIGVYFVSGDKSHMNLKKVLLNPVFISFVIGIVLNLLNVVDFVPQVLVYSNHLKGIVTPVSMVILGMKMGGVKMSSLFTNLKTYTISACKLVLVPIGAVALAYFNRSFRGNLPELLESDHAGHFYPEILANDKIPAQWVQKVLHCSKDCANCTFCRDVFNQSRVTLK